MQNITTGMIKVGDYVKFAGRSSRNLTGCWWKATGIEGQTVHLVDRNGRARRVRTTWRYHELRAQKWEPGDDRND